MIKLILTLIVAIVLLTILAVIVKPKVVDCRGEQEIVIEEWKSSVQPMDYIL